MVLAKVISPRRRGIAALFQELASIKCFKCQCSTLPRGRFVILLTEEE